MRSMDTNGGNTMQAQTAHHYFASFALGWATGATQDEAIEKLVNGFRGVFQTTTKNAQKEGQPGAYIWTCKVLAPADAGYKIEFYAPKGVEITEAQHVYVTYVTAKKASYWKQQDAA